MSDANTTSFSWEIQRKIYQRWIKYFWKIERIQNLMIGSSKIHRCKQSVNLWKPENEPKTFFQLNPNIREVCQSNKVATLNIFWEKKLWTQLLTKIFFFAFLLNFLGTTRWQLRRSWGNVLMFILSNFSNHFARVVGRNNKHLGTEFWCEQNLNDGMPAVIGIKGIPRSFAIPSYMTVKEYNGK